MNEVRSRKSQDAKSRRDFLKLSGGLAAASALTGVAAPYCHAGESNTIKLALVGCGGRGTGAAADALSTSGGPVKIVAMADLFEDRQRASLSNLTKLFPKQVDVPPERRFVGFDAYKKAIDCLGPGDVVLLTTHAAFRPLHFEYAVRKGVNVFLEKSFAVDAPATRRLLKAADESEKKNLKVGVGLMYRHSEGRQELIKRIHDGAIGDVQMLRIYRLDNGLGLRHPPQVRELDFQLRAARCFNWVSGGRYVDAHCHNIDVACWTKGSWPISAQGMGGRCYPKEVGNTFDHSTVEYTFADGAKLFTFTRCMTGCWTIYSDYAHGTKGAAVIMSRFGQSQPRLYKSQRIDGDEPTWRYTKTEPNPFKVEWQLLVDAIRKDRPHNEVRRAGEANLTALMGRMAFCTGKVITRDEAIKSDFAYVKDIDHMTFDTPAPIQPGPDGLYPAAQPGLSKEA